MNRPPIEDGAVLTDQSGRISAVGPWSELRHLGPSLDLGEVVLLPGLINAHCHLDYTDMAGLIAPPKLFPEWVKAILALKAHWSYTDYASSWIRGAEMLLRHGVTTVADIEAVPELLPEVSGATPLRVYSFLEMTGVKARKPATETLNDAIATIDSLPVSDMRLAGLSPHAPYSTTLNLLELSVREARRRNWLLTTHVSESEPEFEMFMRGSGSLFQWLHTQRDCSDCGLGSPVQHLSRAGMLGDNLLAVHVNYLAEGDAERLAGSGTHIVHCPRSHDYFHHTEFPYQELKKAGVNICLGTDSLVSVRKENRSYILSLNPFAEMSLFHREHQVDPEEIVRMWTTHSARALHLDQQAGALSEGFSADLIGLPFAGSTQGAFEAVVQHQAEVEFSLICGEWALPPK